MPQVCKSISFNSPLLAPVMAHEYYCTLCSRIFCTRHIIECVKCGQFEEGGPVTRCVRCTDNYVHNHMHRSSGEDLVHGASKWTDATMHQDIAGVQKVLCCHYLRGSRLWGS